MKTFKKLKTFFSSFSNVSRFSIQEKSHIYLFGLFTVFFEIRLLFEFFFLQQKILFLLHTFKETIFRKAKIWKNFDYRMKNEKKYFFAFFFTVQKKFFLSIFFRNSLVFLVFLNISNVVLFETVGIHSKKLRFSYLAKSIFFC